MIKSDSKRCKKCVLSESFPGIEFDDEGVCSFCREEILFTSDETAISRAKVKIEGLFHHE